MATEYNPRIVTDNLVLCLDAANTKSYPGTGTTWTNMMGVNNGTLTNGVSFISPYEGTGATTFTCRLRADYNVSWTQYSCMSGSDRNGTLSGGDPQIDINVGDTIIFDMDTDYSLNSAAGNLWITTTRPSINAVTNPTATNNGTAGQDISWTPNAAGTYYYQNASHSAMWGYIIVTDPPDPISDCFDFDGTDDYVDLGSIDSSNVLSLNDPAGGGLTMSVAINWTQAGDDHPRIFNKSDGGNGTNGWTLYINRTSDAVGNVRFRVDNNSYTLAASSNVTPETWELWTLTHVDATNGAWVWYKNGISDNSGTQTYNIPDTTTTAIPLTIGRWHNNNRKFKGKIPFVMVYDRALSAAEVKQNFDAVKVRYGL